MLWRQLASSFLNTVLRIIVFNVDLLIWIESVLTKAILCLTEHQPVGLNTALKHALINRTLPKWERRIVEINNFGKTSLQCLWWGSASLAFIWQFDTFLRAEQVFWNLKPLNWTPTVSLFSQMCVFLCQIYLKCSAALRAPPQKYNPSCCIKDPLKNCTAVVVQLTSTQVWQLGCRSDE